MFVKFDPRLSFFTHTRGTHKRFGFLFLVCMRWKTKAIYKNNTQLHFLVKLERSSTLSSFLNIQNLASSRDFVKISAN